MSNTENTAPIRMDARVYPFEEPKGKQLAFASLTINGGFAVTGIKIMDGGEKGLFVAMPSTKNRDGEYKDICFPTSKELREEMNAVVMDAYNAAIEKQLSERAAGKDEQEADKPSATGRLNEAKKETANALRKEKAAVKGDDAR